MDKSIEQLTIIANQLDSLGFSKNADMIDGIARKSLNLVHAQYVGVQGYWIRNSRCWQNCYRQKRADKKDMTSQEVWAECQSEYADSINDEAASNEWAKYAGKQSFEKMASTDYGKKAISKEKDYFHTKVAQKIKGGMASQDAIDITIQEGMERYASALLEEVGSLLVIAKDLRETGHEELATKTAEAANALYKDAGIGKWFEGVMS